jgi:ribosomal protein L23
MKLEPIVTEKSLELSKKGRYTFRVEVGLNKHQIKKLINEIFDVHVKTVKTMNLRSEIKRTLSGRKRKVMPSKKAIVTLADKEKIDIFETKK